MCGIAGIVDLRELRPIDEGLLVRMRDTMTSRGPDEAGILRRKGVGLAHRRLSIIDVASGQQPLAIANGRLTITYNGELYNYREIAQELKEIGHQFTTSSDTEVIIRAWLEWGPGCIDRFRGMFAFAIWDERDRTIFLVRDRLGIKPLYHATTNDGFLVFASELKALAEFPQLNRAIDRQGVENYFALGYVPEPGTIYSGIRKLEPGYYLSATREGDEKTHRYWNVVPVVDCSDDPIVVQRELLERLSEAIDIRLVSEVPLGAFLSGGVDSSAVVALMSRLLKKSVRTCSMGFKETSHDESSYASMVAARYSTEHHSEIVDVNDTSLVDSLAGIYDEPFADSSAIPTLMVCQLARRSVTVALSGDGADELLAGYRRQRMHMNEEKFRGMLSPSLRAAIFGPLGKAFPKADWAPRPFRAKTTLQALAKSSIDAYVDTVSQNPCWVRERLFSKKFLSELGGYRVNELFLRHASDAPSQDPLSLIQYLDLKTYLPGGILTKVDRASMACSLEVRVPFLDHQFVEWCFGLKSKHKLSNGIGKIALKKALEPLLPTEILYRQKRGFSVPLAAWTRGPLRASMRTALLGERLRDSEIFDVSRLDTIVSEHESGRHDHSTLIWSLMMFDGFLALGHWQ